LLAFVDPFDHLRTATADGCRLSVAFYSDRFDREQMVAFDLELIHYNLVLYGALVLGFLRLSSPSYLGRSLLGVGALFVFHLFMLFVVILYTTTVLLGSGLVEGVPPWWSGLVSSLVWVVNPFVPQVAVLLIWLLLVGRESIRTTLVDWRKPC